MKNIVYAVIIAGGEGKRLWPKSNRVSPKHLLLFGSGTSLLEKTFNRLRHRFSKDKILVVTTKKNYRKIKNLLPGLKRENFLVEPEAKNTAPAICLTAFKIEKKNPGAIMAIFPSDHVIKKEKKFFKALGLAIKVAERTNMLGTVGIMPKFPAIGYGYIKIKSTLRQCSGLMVSDPSTRFARSGSSRAKPRDEVEPSKMNYFEVERFIEKPSLTKAKIYARSKEYFWNSGIFIWRASAILEAIKKFNSRLYYSIKRIQDGEDIFKVYNELKNISIDYCVMEKQNNIFTVVGDFDWLDVGSWLSLDKLYKKDDSGNVILAEHKGIDTKDSIVIGESGHLIGTIGVEDLIIVHTKGATLVCNKGRAEEVRSLLE